MVTLDNKVKFSEGPSNDVNELASVPIQEEIDLRYARKQVEISEQ